MRSLKSKALLLALILTGSLLPNDAAAGSLRLRVEDLNSGIGVVLTDTDGDGFVSWNFLGTMGSATLLTTGGGLSYESSQAATIDLFNLTLSVSEATRLRLSLEDSGFTVGGGQVTGLIGGTMTGLNPFSSSFAGSTLEAQTYASPSDAVPNYGPNTGTSPSVLPAIGAIPADAVAAFAGGFVTGPGAFSGTGYTSFVNSGPFSLFSTVTINMKDAGLVSFDLQNVVPVPEPGTLLLFGTGLIGVARLVKRRSNSARPPAKTA